MDNDTVDALASGEAHRALHRRHEGAAALRARVARLAKAWNKQWAEDDRALSSFNIEALVWEFIDDASVPLDQALADWFRYAHDEVDKAETEGPGRGLDPIRLLKSHDLARHAPPLGRRQARRCARE